MTTDEKASLEKLKESIRYVDGRHQVAIPWKDDEPALPNNYEMALRRLLNTEKRLLKNPEIGEAYTSTLRRVTSADWTPQGRALYRFGTCLTSRL